MRLATTLRDPSSAELKQAFLKHLPTRMETVHKRCHRLCADGWDINILTLAFQDIQDLAGTCGTHGLVSSSEKLHELEAFLKPLAQDLLIPDAGQIEKLKRLASEIGSGDVESATTMAGRTNDEVEPVDSELGVRESDQDSEFDIGSLEDSVHGLDPAATSLGADVPPERANDNGLSDASYPFSPDPIANRSAESLWQKIKTTPYEFDPDLKGIEVGLDFPDFDNDDTGLEESLDRYGSGYGLDIDDDFGVETEVEITDAEAAAILGEGLDDHTSVAPIAEPIADFSDTVDPGSAAADTLNDAVEPNPAAKILPPADAESPPAVISDAFADSLPPEDLKPPTPAPASARTPEANGFRHQEQTIYYLKSDTPKSAEISAALLSHQYDLQAFDELADFMDMLMALVPDAIILDVGFQSHLDEISKAIKKIRNKMGVRMPLLVVSSEDDLATRLRSMRAGADAFFNEPFEAKKLADRLDELLHASVATPYQILIVEDDRSQALFAESILTKAGMQTKNVLEPLKVLEVLENFTPDLILMDLYMPECDGIELTAIIRERDAYADTPIVFLSGEHDADKKFDALSVGGDDFLSKPIRPRHLISAVQNRVRRARALHDRMHQKSPQDSLSGLYNRAHIIDRLTAHLAKERPGQTGGIFIVDLDNRQAIRSEIGFSGIDKLTEEMGTIIANQVSSIGAFVAKFGEHSFIIFSQKSAESDMQTSATNICNAIGTHRFENQPQQTMVTVSTGWVMIEEDESNAAKLINKAEQASASAISAGGNRVKMHRKSKQETLSTDKGELRDLLEKAVSNDSLQVLYQPLVALSGESSRQYQTLLRLCAADGSLIPAGQFISLAEESDTILTLDRWVCRQALQTIDFQLRRKKELRLFVSQSSKSINDDTRIKWLEQQIRARGLEGNVLCLEFAQSDIEPQIESAKKFFEQLRQMGIRISIARFDGSDAAFNLLQKLSPDFVKLGLDLLPGNKSNNIMAAVVSKAKSYDSNVIVPMIENARSAASLWTSGADYIQGNFIQAPDKTLQFDFSESAF